MHETFKNGDDSKILVTTNPFCLSSDKISFFTKGMLFMGNIPFGLFGKKDAKNFFGIGMSESRMNEFFMSIGYNYVTSHNLTIDSILTNGIVATFFYILVFIFPILKNIKVKDKRKLISFSICVFIFLQFSPHNIGGLSITALNTAILFGLININSKLSYGKK